MNNDEEKPGPSFCRNLNKSDSEEEGQVEDISCGKEGPSCEESKPTSEDEDKEACLAPISRMKAKMKLESLEFEFLKPICAEVLKEPSEKNLQVLEEALNTMGMVPGHLSDFVMFPFAVHLKIIGNKKESQRIAFFRTFAEVLEKIHLSRSYEMFVNVFQKLFLCLATPANMTVANIQIPEDEMNVIMKCVERIIVNSLPFHLDALCAPDKVHIFGHPVFLLLQTISPDSPKDFRIKSLESLMHIVNLCAGKENRSKALYKFLPGIVSKVRKISSLSVAQSGKHITQLSLSLMGKTISVSTEFDDPKNLEEADTMLSQVVELLSKDYILSTDEEYRKSFLDFCRVVASRNAQLPKCSNVISKILLQLRDDSNNEITKGCVEVLEKVGMVQELDFEVLANLMSSAATHLNSGDEDGCVLTLRETSSVLTTRKLSFVEFQTFLPMVFQFMNAVVWKFRNCLLEKDGTSNPVYMASTKLCQSIVFSTEMDEVVYEFISIISQLPNKVSTVENLTGILVTFNIAVSTIIEAKPDSINEFEAVNLAEVYLSLIDMQSSEVFLTSIAEDIPATQTAVNIRKSYLLKGLGILGKNYQDNVVPIVLYPLIENAGLGSCDSVNESAHEALRIISTPTNVQDFLKKNLEFVLNEIGVRMLSLSLYPNCPNAMVYLAKYFDFSKDTFSTFIDLVFQRCSDEFGGGSVQHIYVKVFYALITSISNHFTSTAEVEKIELPKESSLLDKLLHYQQSVGIMHPSVAKEMECTDLSESDKASSDEAKVDTEELNVDESHNGEESLDSVREFVLRISHRVLNFLPNNERSVRLPAIESLICGLPLLKNHENSILPLSHTIWQNLIPRFDDKDYVIVRKSFELLQVLCTSSGTFLKKRVTVEVFPKLSTLLLNLAKESEQVKNKNRQYYTYTQAYKLQLTVLQGLGTLLDAIDVQEMELDKIVSGSILYLNPDQHKNLREAAIKLLEVIANGRHSRTVWIKLIACGYKTRPAALPHPSFVSLPKAL